MAFQMMSLILVVTALYSGECRDINDNMTYGVYTFFGDQLLPSFVSLNVTLNGTLLCMNLERNVDMAHDIPLYALSKDSKGLYHTQKVQMDTNKVFAVYIDSSLLAAFRIVHEMDKNGKSRMLLEGIVHSKGKIYHLKNRKQFKKKDEEERNVTKEMKTNRTENGQTTKDVFYFQELDQISTTQNDTLFKSIHSPNQGRIFENKEFTLPHLRQKQQVTQDINIDIVAVVDFAVYSRWYYYSTPDPNTETQEQSTFNEIWQFYSLVFNGVNMLYKTITELPYTIHVRLSAIFISVSASSSPWTEQYRQRDTPWDKVDANLALGFFKKWAPEFLSVARSDHMVLFTGYNMITTANNKTSDSIIGLAWVGTACEADGTSSSLVEDLGGFQVIGTVTHELGHSLSAQHDGTENSCKADDRYIMSPGDSNRTEENKLNPWRFSSCSPVYFNTYIARQVRTEQGRECMYGVTSIEDVTPLLPGQVYNATEQCRLRYGPQSYVCQHATNWNLSDVCIKVYCHKPGDSLYCYYLDTAQGTPCGNKKWCVDGLCTYSNEAPAIDDDCIFGDDGDQAPLSRSCSSLVSEFPGNCYNSLISRKCCQSCSALRSTEPNCQYGDIVQNCDKRLCYDDVYKQKCCRTCNYVQSTTSLLLGQVYNVNEQCVQIYGPGSYMCQQMSNWNVSKVCSVMYCNNPLGDPNMCYGITPAEGTTCDNKQWCVNGQCVFDNNAPVVDDACILGDDLNPTAFYGQPCSHLLSTSSYCSLAYIRERCCQTCANLLTPSFHISTIPSTRTTLITATMHRATTSKPASTAMSQTVSTKPTTTNGPTTISKSHATTNMSTTISTKSTTNMSTRISIKSTTNMSTRISTKSTTNKSTTISTKSTTNMSTTISTKSTTNMSTPTIATKKETIITVGLTTNSTSFSTTPTADSTRAIIYCNFAGRLGNLTCSRFIVLIAIFVTLNWL